MSERVAYLRARYDDEPPTPIIVMQRRMLDELHPAIEAADSTIAGEWGSSDDLADTLLDLLMLPFYLRDDCRYDWVAHVDRLAEKCAHEDAYETQLMGEPETKNYCPDCTTSWAT